MKKLFFAVVAMSTGISLSGCLDMSFTFPEYPNKLNCPEGYAPLSDTAKECPKDKLCETVVDPDDKNHVQLCVEYHVDTSGGDGPNCDAGSITVTTSELSSDKCETTGAQGEAACFPGHIAGRYCRNVPEENPNSLVNIIQGMRCTNDQANPKDDTLRVHLMDIGQGDSIWIQTPAGMNILIDGGDMGVLGKTAAGPIVTDYLEFHGFPPGSMFDAVFLTHPHADHFGGLPYIFGKGGYKLANYIDPMEVDTKENVPSSYVSWVSTVKKSGAKMYMPAEDYFMENRIMPENFFGKDVTAQYIYSQKTFTPKDNNNSASIIFKLTYAGRSFIFTGDAEAAQEAQAVSVGDLDAHFLKVCHHGSSTSSSVLFLDAIWNRIPLTDRYALISSGRKQYSGSYIPTTQTITTLMNYVQLEHLLSTSAGDDDKEEHDTYRDDNILVVVKPNGDMYACYNGTN